MCTHEVHVTCTHTHTHTWGTCYVHTHKIHVMCTNEVHVTCTHIHIHTHTMRFMLCANTRYIYVCTRGTCYVHKQGTCYMNTHTHEVHVMCTHMRYHLTHWWWLCTPFINSPQHPRMNEETNKVTTLYIMNLLVLWFEQYT